MYRENFKLCQAKNISRTLSSPQESNLTILENKLSERISLLKMFLWCSVIVLHNVAESLK